MEENSGDTVARDNTTLTPGQVAETVGGEVIGDADRVLRGVAPLDTATPDDLSFLTHDKYRTAFAGTRAGAAAPAQIGLDDAQ